MNFTKENFSKLLEYTNRIHNLTLNKHMSNEDKLRTIHEMCDFVLDHEH